MKSILRSIGKNHPALSGCGEAVEQAYQILLSSVNAGGKILVCGNGGSAADSEHIVGELMKGFQLKRPVAADFRSQLTAEFGETEGTFLADHLQGTIPAISLVSHVALMTAFINDVEATMVFAQQVLGYGKAGDCLLALSTSGNSTNVVNAVKVAKVLGVRTIGFTGASGGKLTKLCDVCIQVPGDETAVIQQYHQIVYHGLCAALEEALFNS